MLKQIKYTILVALFFGLFGCAANKGPVNPQDPYEHINRKIFAFNMAFDHAFVRPLAKAYDTVMPWPLKKGVTHFFNNIGDVTSAANEILQLEFRQATLDIVRVVINTTIGIGGLFDVATHMGIERDAVDFGMTLARWGSRDTPYIVLPFMGPSAVRDAIGLPVNYLLLSPWAYIDSAQLQWGLAGLYAVQRRAILLIGDKVISGAFDPYVFVRDAYIQRREYLINENDKRHVEQRMGKNGNHRKTRALQPEVAY